MDTFNNSLADDGFIIIESKSSSIPPASVHSFLKADPKFPGVVLTGFDEKFKNKYVFFLQLILIIVDSI